jgi:protein-disulfide isomerase
MKMTRIALFRWIVILALPAFFLEAAPAQSTAPEPYVGGTPDAPIRVEVFSDFECPGCRDYYLNTIRLVLKEYCSVGKVCVIYREFPLPGHKYSLQAAKYSKAAQRLGRKQWIAVLDALYAKQPAWIKDGKVDDVVFEALGADDYFQVRRLLLDPSIESAVQEEVAEGKKKEVTSTPTSFIYAIGREQKVVGSLPYPVMKDFFDRIVK